MLYIIKVIIPFGICFVNVEKDFFANFITLTKKEREPNFFCGKKKSRRGSPLRDLHTLVLRATVCLAVAISAVVSKFEGSTLGLFRLTHVALGAAHLDLIQGAVGVLVVGAAVDGALDAGVGITGVIVHVTYLLELVIQKEYAPTEAGLFPPWCIECVGGEYIEFEKQSNYIGRAVG